MSICNVIPEFTPEQIAKCRLCRYASEKKKFCTHLGCWIDGRSISGRSKTKLNHQTQRPPLTVEIITASYAQLSYAFVETGRPVITEAEYIKRRMMCKECSGGYTCPGCGCGLSSKLLTPDWKCPMKKW